MRLILLFLLFCSASHAQSSQKYQYQSFPSYINHHIDEYEDYSHLYVEIIKGHLQFIRTNNNLYHLTASIEAPVVEPGKGFQIKFENGDIWKIPETQIAVGPTSFNGSTLGYISDFGFHFSGTTTTTECLYMVSIQLSPDEVERLITDVIIGFKIGQIGRQDFSIKKGRKFMKRINELVECDYADMLGRIVRFRGEQ